MGHETLAHDSTIGLIYEAAAGRAPWELAMHAIARSLGLLLAQVIGVDMKARLVIFSFEGGTGSAEATLDYTRKYHSVDPHVEHLAKLGLGEYVERFHRERTLTVPATEIARERIGRPMPNAVLLGGFTALCDVVSIEAVEKAIAAKLKGAVAEANVLGAREAAEFVRRERTEVVGA